MPLDVKAATARPRALLRAARGGGARVRRMLREQGVRATGAEVMNRLRRAEGSPRASAVMAASAAFTAGEDDVVETMMADLGRRFPYAAAVHELRADLLAFRGDYPAAVAAARTARLVEPSRSPALSRVVHYSSIALDRAEADRIALEALRRMPRDGAVLWAVAKGCSTADQATRVVDMWRELVPDPREVPAAVRQLATAAARGRRADVAADLYKDAIVAVHSSGMPAQAVRVRQLAGKGAWAAIEDIADVLDTAGVPYFFAAGTALGLIREGQPLDLDGDIDVGVFESDWDRDGLIETFRADPRFVLDPNPISTKVGVKHRGGSPIDIFRYYAESGKVWHDGVFVRWWNTPFDVERRPFRDREFPVPKHHDLYLSENYGDWRTPNARYDVFTEAPNVEVHWPEYARLHLIRRAYAALTSGRLDAAIDDLRTAGEADLAARLGGDSPPVGDGPVSRDSRPPADDPIEADIRDGRWSDDRLRVRLADSASGYDVVRRLWLDSPRECSQSVPIMSAVARAAALAGDHEVARTLAGKAAFVSVQRSRAAQKLVHGIVSDGASPDVSEGLRLAATDDTEADEPLRVVTFAYVELVDAIVNRDPDTLRKTSGVLRRYGEADWLAFA